MRQVGWICGLVSILMYAAAAQPAPVAPRNRARLGRVPMAFEANRGQADSKVKFVSRGAGYAAFLTAGGITLSLHTYRTTPSDLYEAPTQPTTRHSVVRFSLVGANKKSAVVGENPLPGRVNYFIGNDPKKWHTNVPTYAQIRYTNLYPGIDLVYYGNQRQLEYDFAVSPGADPRKIRIEISGAKHISIDPDGNLVLQVDGGSLQFQSPNIYQESEGRRISVRGRYVLSDSTHVGFEVAGEDRRKTLVIDPVLLYSTYLGGTGENQAMGMAVDDAGNIYMAGYTDATDFPLATLGTLPPGANHIFVAKLDSTASNLLYADYLGGNGQDYGYGLAINKSNEVYVTGSTSSSDFPLVNAYQPAYPGGFNAIVSKLSDDGASLLYSSYLGGNGTDLPASIAVDNLSNIMIAGNTTSTNFPVANAFQPSATPNQGGLYGTYGFVTKFTADGSSLVYSTYFAGDSNQANDCGGVPCWPEPYSAVQAMAIDAGGNAYLTGTTNTYNFPASAGAYSTVNSTLQNAVVGFVSKLTSAGALSYSSYFYETSGVLTNPTAIAVDSSGSAYVAGSAWSDGTFPITSTTICDPAIYADACGYAFVTKFDAGATSLLYSTFLGPDNGGYPASIALDGSNNAYVLTTTSSNTFGIVNGIESYSGGNDVLLAEIDATAGAELFATYLGGSADENATAIVRDPSGNLFVTGTTTSVDFPAMQNSYQGILGPGRGGSERRGNHGPWPLVIQPNMDVFLAKIGPADAPAVSIMPATVHFFDQQIGTTSKPFSALLRDMGSAGLSIASVNTSAEFAETDDCGTAVPAASSCTFSVTFTPAGPGARTGTISIQDDAAGSPHVIHLEGTGLGAFVSLSPSTLSFPDTPLGSTSAKKSLILANTGNADLNVSAIQTAGDFTQTNDCPATLLAGDTCSVDVTFSPAIAGKRAGSLAVTDDALGSPQSSALAGYGVDFDLAATPDSRTVIGGTSASYQLSISPLGGSFGAPVLLSCGELPKYASCSFSPNAVTPNGTAATSILTISTASTTARVVPVGAQRFSAAFLFALCLQFVGIGFVGMKDKGNRVWVMAAMASLFAFLLLTGCSATHSAPAASDTPAGDYTVTVTATSGSLQHSSTVELTVK